VYDTTAPESFDRVKKWAEELNAFSKNGLVIAIAGNKVDKGINGDKEEILR